MIHDTCALILIVVCGASNTNDNNYDIMTLTDQQNGSETNMEYSAWYNRFKINMR